jgi:uncharacterized coiled-coil protein SlyX
VTHGAADAIHVRLATAGGTCYVGLPVAVIATVATSDERPVSNLSVYLSTSWGGLRSVEGATVRRGTSVPARTDGTGTATVSLVPPTTDDLREDEEAALNVMLSRLDSTASRPGDVADALADLAREYRLTLNGPFRRAVDVLFRDLRPEVIDTVHAYDFSAAWHTTDAIVACHVARDSHGGELAAAAVVQVQFRNWLGAFLQAYGSLPDVEREMDARLADITSGGDDAGNLLTDAFGRVRGFARDELGLLGAHFAPQAAERSLRRFVDASAEHLPLDTRLQLLPALDATAATVEVSGLDVAGAVTRARTDFNRTLSATVAEVDPAALRQRLGAVETQVTATSAAVDDVKGQVTHHATSLEQIQTQVQSNQTQLETFNGRLDVLNQTVNTIDINEINTIRDRVNNLQDIENQVTAASSAIDELKGRIAATSATIDEVKGQVTRDATSLEQIQTQVQSNQTQLETFNGRLDVLNQTVNTIDVNEINTLRDRVNNLQNIRIVPPGVAAAAEEMDRLREEIATLTRRVARIESPPGPE